MRGIRVIVGLGNPTAKYANTRHNVGAMTVERLAARWGVALQRRNPHALVGQGRVDGTPVALARPRAFMNECGPAVAYLAARFRAPLDDVLIVLDDMDLPLGVTRLRPGGGNGGHNGLRSIIDTLGAQDVPRLRLGVGRSPVDDAVRHVLGAFTPGEQAAVDLLLARAEDAVACFVTEGLQAAMNQFNHSPADADAEADAVP